MRFFGGPLILKLTPKTPSPTFLPTRISPIKGIFFIDVLPILEHPDIFEDLINNMSAGKIFKNSDAIISVDARGFIFGAHLAKRMGVGFIPVRKKGKLPPPVISKEYELEYGKDTLEIKNDEDGLTKVIIVDDVYATGGTAKATRDLCEEAGYDVVDEIFLINLFYVNNNSRVKSVLTYK